MINASAADAHRFGRVKRNGYDPVEVEAVVSRLTDTLRTYETRTVKLEQRLEEADASADAIRQTFITAQKTSDEILDSARTEAKATKKKAKNESKQSAADAQALAKELTASAEAEATEVAELARQLDAEVAQRRNAILSDTYEEVEAIAVEAEADAATRLTNAARDADALVEAASETRDTSEREVAEAARVASMANAWMSREATIEAATVVTNAEQRAAVLIAAANIEAEAVRKRAAELRDAVANIEASARTLADVTSQEASVIDLSKIEAIEASATTEPDPQHADTDPSAAAEVTSDLDWDAAPILTVAEAQAALNDEPDEIRTEDAEPASSTFYQRSTGTPLSERVKIAKMSR